MKPHDTYLAFAAMAIDEALAPSDRTRLEQHLGGCAVCAREVARLRGDTREFAELAVPPLPGRRSDEILAAALHPSIIIHPIRLLAVAALLGLLLVGSLAAGSQLIRRDDDLSVVLPVPSATAMPSDTRIPSTPPPTTTPSAEPTASLPPSPGFILHPAPAQGGPACDAIGADPTPHSLTFRIDPTAAEQVTALTDTGVTFTTYWSAGFQPGTATERVIRDPEGQVVVADGDMLAIPEAANPRLHGYLVVGCNGSNTLYVFLTDPVS